MTMFPGSPMSNPGPGSGQEGGDISLSKLVAALSARKWLILGVSLLCMAAGYFYASSQPRIYQADAMLQVENKGATLGLLETLGVGEQGGNPTTAELEILQSRMVMGETVDRLDLAIQVTPRRMPLIGNFLVEHGVTHAQVARLIPGWGWLERLGLAVRGEGLVAHHVWAGERLEVSRLEVPASALGERLRLRVLDEGRYAVWSEAALDAAGDSVPTPLISGRVGETASDAGGDYRLFVSRLEAHPGAEFELRRMSRLNAIHRLQRSFSIVPRGKDSGVFQVLLNGPDRQKIVATLDTLNGAFLTQNVQRQSEEAEKQIAFLDAQIPQVSAELIAAENQLNEYRAQRDSVDLTFETQNLLNSLVSVENRLSELRMAEADLAQRFTPQHPNYQSLIRQRGQLNAERQALEAQIGELPETQQEVLRLNRDTQVNQQIYVQLLNQRQEMRLVKAGTVGNVRILDHAELLPGSIAPRIPLVSLVSALLGALLAVAFIILRLVLSRTIKSPEQLEEFGLPVYATLPVSAEQSKLTRRLKMRRGGKGQGVFRGLLAVTHPEEIAVEALRGLRTSLYFAMLESHNNRLMIAGSGPEVGKSFISANLAVVCAQAGQRVVLVDADMRRGHLHHAFRANSDGGLSELLAGRLTLDEALRHSDVDGLDYLTRGTVPPNPSELLMQARFHELLDELSARYDLVVIDTPPVLAVTDAVIVGKLAGTSLVVVRFAHNPLAEVKAAKRRLENAGVRLKGAILNGIERTSNSRYGYYGSYLYAYR